MVPLISHAATDQAACRNFCFALYQLSLVGLVHAMGCGFSALWMRMRAAAASCVRASMDVWVGA